MSTSPITAPIAPPSTPIPTLATKGGLKFKTKFSTVISASDVANYLTNEVFKLPIKVSLRTIHGPNPTRGAYVITVLAIAESDLAVTSTVKDYSEKVLASFGANTKYKKEILDKVDNYRLPTPEQFDLTMRTPEGAKQLTNIGIWGDNLININQYSSFKYSPQTGFYVIYLDTEKILKEMAQDPLDHEIKGIFDIKTIYGEKDEAIRWEVEIDAGNGGASYRTTPFNVSIDRIIATAR